MLERIVSDFFEKTEGLFDRDYESLVLKAIKETLGQDIDTQNSIATYPEFPLIGESWLDYTVGIDGGALEYDLSTRGLNTPTRVNFFNIYKPGEEEKVLKPLNALSFSDCLYKRMLNAPKEFSLRYASYFKGRGKDGLRLGTYYIGEKMDPDIFANRLASFGYQYVNDQMKDCLRLAREAIPGFDIVEVCLDLMPDGSFGDRIGLIFNLPARHGILRQRTKTFFKECGYEALLKAFEEKGFIDSRWEKARDAIYARRYYQKTNPAWDECMVLNCFRGTKISWEAGKILPTKMYMDFVMMKNLD